MVQAGALLALVGGILAVAPAAAMAVQPTVTIDNVSTDLASGGTTNLQYTVSNQNLPGGDTSVRVTVSGLSCSGECGAVVQIDPQGNATRNAQLTAPQVAAGQTKSVTLTITATAGSDTVTATQKIDVHGADKPQSVRQISGKVKDSKGKAIAGASVGAKDSNGTLFETQSNADGGYAITSSDAKPIAVGSIIIGAAKDGYNQVTVTRQGGADKSINVLLTLTAIAASPSVTPSASASVSAEPTEEATDGATDDATSAPPALNNTAGDDKGSGSTLYIVLGVLLVAAGIGAIVLVLMRRKDAGGADGADDSDDPDGPDGPNAPKVVVPASQGRFNNPDATRIGAPVGVRASEATMVTNLAPQSPMADAPTMLQQAVPVEDEFPDPYGAPAVTPGNYAGAGGWGAASAAPAGAGTYGAAQPGGTYGAGGQYGAAPAQAGGYDDGGYGANQYGQPSAGDGYGAGQYGAPQYGGAPAEQRFDEPTGMYRPDPQGGYRQDQGGYEQPSGYEQGGYDQGGQAGYPQQQQGYGPQGYDQGGYRAAPESGPYGAGGEYRPEPEYPPAGQGGGYPAGGYQGGGYNGAPAPAQGGGYNGAPAPAQGGGYNGAPAPAQGGGGYGAPAPGYGGAPAPAGGGYGDGSWNAPGGGIDSGNAYGPPAGGGYAPGGGYGGPPAGYGDQGGYAQGGYDQGGGYGRPEGYDQDAGRQQQGGGGYGAGPSQGGHYGGEPEGGGRHGGQSRPQPPQESTHPGQRRPLDWLDD